MYIMKVFNHTQSVLWDTIFQALFQTLGVHLTTHEKPIPLWSIIYVLS